MTTYRDLTDDEMQAGMDLIRLARRDDVYDTIRVQSARSERLMMLAGQVAEDFDFSAQHLVYVTACMLEKRLRNVPIPDRLDEAPGMKMR